MNRTPACAAMLDLLADGQWHTRDEVIAAGVAHVPPGHAYRRGEHSRLRQGGPTARTRGDRDTAIAAGAHDLSSKQLGELVHRGRVLRDGDHYRLACG